MSDGLAEQPLKTGHVLFYLDKNGSFVLIGNETIANGRAVLNTTVDPLPQPRLKIVFIEPSGIYVSGGEERLCKIYILPQRTPPLPEPWFTPLLVIIAVIVFTARRRAKPADKVYLNRSFSEYQSSDSLHPNIYIISPM